MILYFKHFGQFYDSLPSPSPTTTPQSINQNLQIENSTNIDINSLVAPNTTNPLTDMKENFYIHAMTQLKTSGNENFKNIRF